VSDEVTNTENTEALSEKVVAEGTTADAGVVTAEGEPKAKGKSVFDQARYKYAANEHKTASGRASVDNGDQVAVAIRGKDADAVVALVEANGGQAKPNWKTLNPGLRRMSAANVLRGLLSKNGKITVEGNEIVKVEKPKAPATEAPAANTESTDTAAA
jgi:hypothetical protein